MRSQRVGHDLASLQQHTYVNLGCLAEASLMLLQVLNPRPHIKNTNQVRKFRLEPNYPHLIITKITTIQGVLIFNCVPLLSTLFSLLFSFSYPSV